MKDNQKMPHVEMSLLNISFECHVWFSNDFCCHYLLTPINLRKCRFSSYLRFAHKNTKRQKSEATRSIAVLRTNWLHSIKRQTTIKNSMKNVALKIHLTTFLFFIVITTRRANVFFIVQFECELREKG